MLDYVFNVDPIVHYVSSPCGRGKTYAACKFMRDNQFHANHLYVAPSWKLIEKTQKTLRDFSLEPMLKTSSLRVVQVKSAINGVGLKLFGGMRQALNCVSMLYNRFNHYTSKRRLGGYRLLLYNKNRYTNIRQYNHATRNLIDAASHAFVTVT